MVRRIWFIARAILLVIVMILLLVQTYGLYMAAALIPHRPWRRRVDFHLRRAMFNMDNMRLSD